MTIPPLENDEKWGRLRKISVFGLFFGFLMLIFESWFCCSFTELILGNYAKLSEKFHVDFSPAFALKSTRT